MGGERRREERQIDERIGSMRERERLRRERMEEGVRRRKKREEEEEEERISMRNRAEPESVRACVCVRSVPCV